MNLGIIMARVRRLKGSPAPTRWTQADLTDEINNAQVQTALAVDFPQDTLLIPTLQTPTNAPTCAIHGTPGTAQVMYAFVEVAQTGGGDSAPSPNAQLTTAPNTLDATNYVAVTFATKVGTMYRVLRQILGTDILPTLLTSVRATAASTTVNDQGQYVAQQYRVTRGNEYQLPELIKILRAYLRDGAGNAQPLVPLDLSIIGGDTNESWDQSSGEIIGNPVFTPQWIAQGPAPFPVLSPVGGRVQVATPWQNVSQGQQRAGYALRGGFFIVLPPTVGTYQICIDTINKPAVMRQPSDLSVFPDAFLDAVSYKTLEYLSLGDDDTRDADYNARFTDECSRLRISHVDTIMANKPRSIVPLSQRVQFREWPV